VHAATRYEAKVVGVKQDADSGACTSVKLHYIGGKWGQKYDTWMSPGEGSNIVAHHTFTEVSKQERVRLDRLRKQEAKEKADQEKAQKRQRALLARQQQQGQQQQGQQEGQEGQQQQQEGQQQQQQQQTQHQGQEAVQEANGGAGVERMQQ
jgi:hypothetical protein